MAEVLSTIVLHFEGNAPDAPYSCQYELDDILNEEKTSFLPEEDVYFLIKCSSNIRITNILTTNGSVFSLGSVNRQRIDYCLFVELSSEDTKPSLTYRPNSTPSVHWYGNVGGPIYVDYTEQTVDVRAGTIPCFGRLTYNVSFQLYRFSPGLIVFPADEDTYQIHIVIYLEEV